MSSEKCRETSLKISSRCAGHGLSLEGSVGRAPRRVHESGGTLVLEGVIDDERRDCRHACGGVEGLADAGSEQRMEEEGVRRRRRW